MSAPLVVLKNKIIIIKKTYQIKATKYQVPIVY